MAFVAPDVTVFTLTTQTINGLLEALYAHWEPGGPSIKFTATDPTGAPTGASSFTLTPDAAGESWQLNFRFASTEYANLAIDPNAQITDSANPSGSASAAWSGELSSLWYDISELNGKVAIIEFDDAIFVLMSNTDDTAFGRGIHAGRIFTPFWSSDAALGKTGLGYMGRIPGEAYSGSSQSYWTVSYTQTQTSFAPDYVKFQEGDTTSQWYPDTQFYWDKGLTETESTLGTTTTTTPILLGHYYFPRPIGFLRYIYSWWQSATPKTRIDDGNGVKLIHIWATNALSYMVIPWDASTLP